MESSADMYITKRTEARSPFMIFEQKTGIPYKDEEKSKEQAASQLQQRSSFNLTSLQIPFISRNSSIESAHSKGHHKEIFVEYDNGHQIQIDFQVRDQKKLTCGWLLNEVIKKFNESNMIDYLKKNDKSSSQIVQLRTKEQSLPLDYYLTQHDRPLSILHDKIVLLPYFKPQTMEKERHKPCLNDYEILAEIGKGGFSTVYLARRRSDGNFFAIKKIQKGDLNEKARKNIMRERDNMIELGQTNFQTKLYAAFQTDSCCYLVLAFLPGGDLHYYMKQNGRFSEEDAKHIIAETISALEELHCKNILFRDIKTENLILDLDGHIHLADFGLSKKVDDVWALNHSVCGTPGLIAPEICEKKGHNVTAECYNIGTLVFELLFGQAPEAYRKMMQEKQPETKLPNPFIPSKAELSSEVVDFIKNLLQCDPSKRLGHKNGLLDVKNHPWLKDVKFSEVERKKTSVITLIDPKISHSKVTLLSPISLTGSKSRRSSCDVSKKLSDFSFDAEEEALEDLNLTTADSYKETKSPLKTMNVLDCLKTPENEDYNEQMEESPMKLDLPQSNIEYTKSPGLLLRHDY